MNFQRSFAWVLVVAWMGVIFYLSHQEASVSSELSSGITEMFIQLVEMMIPFLKLQQESWHFFFRKGAHFFAYFLLGILLVHALRVSGVHQSRVIWAILISIIYAISDEVHQLFIPGRSGEVRDVLIDTLGAMSGIGCYQLLLLIILKVKVKNSIILR